MSPELTKTFVGVNIIVVPRLNQCCMLYLHGVMTMTRHSLQIKVKLVHLRREPKTVFTNYNFALGSASVNIVHQCEYLGLVINEFLDFNVTAKMVAKSASRALGLVIGKAKSFLCLMNVIPNCLMPLYNLSLIMVVSFGALSPSTA